MKNIGCIIVIAACLMTGSVALAEKDTETRELQKAMYKMAVEMWEASRNKECKAYSDLSPALLDFRKQGKGSLAVYMKWATTAHGDSGLTETMKEFRIRIVRNVFDAPLYETQDRFEREQARLRDETFMDCFDNWSEIGIPYPSRDKYGLDGS